MSTTRLRFEAIEYPLIFAAIHPAVRIVMASEKPTVAFVLSLVAGILIMLRGGITGMMGAFLSSNGYGGYGGMMNGYNGYSTYGGY